MHITTMILFLAFLLAFGIGMIILQIFLSKKENKWPGLILPIIFFSFSLLQVFGSMLFSITSVTTTLMENGEIIERTGEVIIPTAFVIATTVYTFLLMNIPTVILIIVYLACRGKRKKQRALEKMSVQDLE